MVWHQQIVFDEIWVGVSLETGIMVLTWGHSSPTKNGKRNELVWKAHHTGTSAWFFEGSALAEWKESGSLLWIHGKRRFSLLLECARINGFLIVQPGQGKVHFCMYCLLELFPIAHNAYQTRDHRGS
jgi:hypothetical protein